MNLFNLFAKISLDDKDFEKGINNAEKKGSGLTKTFQSIGGGLKTIATATAGAIAVTSTAVAGLVGLSVKQYAEYEQLIGGVETLFKTSSGAVENYANLAYKTAGLSANQYMETITGFSASLLQGLGGDTEKASEIGNKAIIDMSDNANKMGTSMESIQNAYQGFAKQNYTMLDNLKLGYGGTKEEMARLLQDASELSGMDYSIGNFSDIIEAIHVVQTELDITGTTAKESATTISGSFNSLKSAWSNLLTAFSDENADFDSVVGALFDSVKTFASNILPRVKVALEGIDIFIREFSQGIPQLIMEILPQMLKSGSEVVSSLIIGIANEIPNILKVASDIIKKLLQGINGGMGGIVNIAFDILNTLIVAIVDILPMLLETGLKAIITLGQGISSNIGNLIPIIIDLIISMADMIIDNLPTIFDTAIEIILALIQGLMDALPTLIAEVPRIINSFSTAIYNQLPKILKAGIDILLMLIKGIIDSIPTLLANIPQIIMAIVNVITLYNWWNLGKNVITGIGEGIKGMGGSIKSTVTELFTNLINSIKNIFASGTSIGSSFITLIKTGISNSASFIVNAVKGVGTSVINAIKGIFSLSASDIGLNLVKGIWTGISNASGWLLDKISGFAGGIIDGIKGFFDINSPSRVMRDEVGKYMAQGIGVGFGDEMDKVNKEIENSLTADFNVNGNNNKKVSPQGLIINQTINSKATLSPFELAQETKNGIERARWVLA